ncbi:hypothetical protein EZS27_035098 [termite gut metagenome]|uniref:Uncharacterized protein n=1 Tax=termite gut metagenome TaxID=433724 RepID=A0A5J4PYS1_9ZZZZ
MKKQHYKYLLLIISLTGILPSVCAKERKVHSEIDWSEFMQKQDMVWETLPEKWYESVYLGNGMLGLMIYKEPEANYIRFETGNCAVHDHRETNDLFGIPRLLTGHFALHPKGKILNGTMRLDLWNAEASAIIQTTEGEIHLRSIVHASEMIIIIQLTCK